MNNYFTSLFLEGTYTTYITLYLYTKEGLTKWRTNFIQHADKKKKYHFQDALPCNFMLIPKYQGCQLNILKLDYRMCRITLLPDYWRLYCILKQNSYLTFTQK
eukprot:XP_016662163.1 PREDICTED: uncharacterized protein LOC107884483 [Acyrthosiphon pisum]